MLFGSLSGYFGRLMRINNIRCVEQCFSVFHGQDLPENRRSGSVRLIRIITHNYILPACALIPASQTALVNHFRGRRSLLCGRKRTDGDEDQDYQQRKKLPWTQFGHLHNRRIIADNYENRN